MEVPAFTTTNLLALRCVLIFLICTDELRVDGAVTSYVAALGCVALFAGAALLLSRSCFAGPLHSLKMLYACDFLVELHCESCNHAIAGQNVD